MMWPLSCYATKGDESNLLGGDSSFEEVRWVSYALLRRGQDPRQVGAKVDEFARGKESDIRAILGFPNAQLKQVLEMAAAGTMAPAGLTRVIDCTFAGLAAPTGAAASRLGMPPQHPQPAGGFGVSASPGAFSTGGALATPFGGGGANPATPFGGSGANPATPFGGGAPSPGIGNASIVSPFGGMAPAAGGFGGGALSNAFGGSKVGGTAFGGGGEGSTACGGGGAGGTAFGGNSGGTAFGGGGSASTSAATTLQPDMFGTAAASAGEDNPWTAQFFAAGAIPDAPPPREMV